MIANPPGSTAPGSATTTRSPAAKLRAPQTMPRGSPAPDVDLAPADRLAVAGGELLELQHPADHAPARPGRHRPRRSPRPRGRAGPARRRSPGPSASAAARRARAARTAAAARHQTSVPNGSVNRTSPSNMSRMSVDVVPGHQRPLDAHAEREAAVALRVDAAGDQHPRVDHAAAAPLDPALGLAGPARPGGSPTDAPRQTQHCRSNSADGSVNGKKCGRNRVAQAVRRTSARRSGRACPRRWAIVMPSVDGETLDLVEDRAVGRVELVGAVGPARARRRRPAGCAQQRPGLHRRGVGAQHAGPGRRLDVERVLHGAGRVVLAEVERVEVEPLGLDLGTLGDLVAHRDEHVGDPVGQAWSAGAGRRAGGGPTAA